VQLLPRPHPGGNPGANLRSISHKYHLFEVAFVWELTKETIVLPLGCLQGGCSLGRKRSYQHLEWEQISFSRSLDLYLRGTTQRTTKGLSARNPPKIRYLIRRTPLCPCGISIGPMDCALPGSPENGFEVRSVAHRCRIL